jgi:hypothetical protein
MRHPHFDIIEQWVEDTSIEIQIESGGVWYPAEPPMWYPGCNYRIAPKMIRVGRHSWPEPLKEVVSGVMYTFNFITREITELYTLKPSTNAVMAGVAHATREDAQRHLDALICINKGDIE